MNALANHRLRLLLAGILLLPLLACSSDQKKKKAIQPFDLEAEAKKAAGEKREIRDLFSVKSGETEYAYNPIGRRDPFKKATGASQLIAVQRGGPLTSFDLAQMKLVAVISGISDPRGMIQLPDGKSYIVRRNSPIGRNFGKVARITPKAVIIEEEFRGPLGDLQVKETKLVLYEEVGKNAPLELKK